jgi:hypothetical protein
VREQPDETHAITCTRLAGDTFSFHSVFRELKAVLGATLTAHPVGKR